jgi:hypothetical protein
MSCRRDAYSPAEALLVDEAPEFHAWQAGKLADTGADFLLAATLPALSEATGLALALAATGKPRLAISAESARDAPWDPPFGASSWAWLILSFRRVFLWKTFFILSASGLALVWHLGRRHRRLFGATRAGISATETKLTPTPIP